MERENRELLVEGAKTFEIDLDQKTVDLFDCYLKELLKWNQKINLTAIRTEKGIILKHFLDSLSIYPHVTEIQSLLDIGSGAGFPGIPLKIVQPSLQVTLVDSVLKKVDFQRHILRLLGREGVETIHGRVQERELIDRMGRRFDAVVSRAFADLETFLALGCPFLREGGVAIAMKGDVNEKEIGRITGLEESGYVLQKTESFVLPFSSFKRTILVFGKK